MASSGLVFRQLLSQDSPVALVGTINAYSAILAKRAGHKAIYLSGAGVANASFGLPDLGFTSLADVCEDTRRICAVSDLPLIVDMDTGWDNPAQSIRQLITAGAAGGHIEDQIEQKRCGHRPNKSIVPLAEMLDRIKSVVDARSNDFFLIARTDAVAVEGMNAALDRAQACIEAGADGFFPEALSSLEEYKAFCEALDVPVLANITEFGKTPLFKREQLAAVGVKIVLYPLSAFRAMSHAAQQVYEHIHQAGGQADIVGMMQSREELYDCLDYYQYEQEMDQNLKASE